MEKQKFKFDELYFQKCRKEFIFWLETVLEREVMVEDLDVWITDDGKFSFTYSLYNTRDQIEITRNCYPNCSFDTSIQMHANTYDVKILNIRQQKLVE